MYSAYCTWVGVMWFTSSFARCFRRVVLPALSRPNSKMRSSCSGVDFSFLKSDSKPSKYISKQHIHSQIIKTVVKAKHICSLLIHWNKNSHPKLPGWLGLVYRDVLMTEQVGMALHSMQVQLTLCTAIRSPRSLCRCRQKMHREKRKKEKRKEMLYTVSPNILLTVSFPSQVQVYIISATYTNTVGLEKF